MSAVAVALLMALGTLWSGGARAQACNLALNGSFESPNIQTEPQRPGENTAFVNGYAIWRTTTYPIDGWQTVAGTVDFLRYYNNASHGTQSIDLFGTAAATFRQTFTGLVPGRQYSFSIDYSGHSTTQAPALVQLGNGGAPVTVASLRPAVNAVSNGNAGIPATPAFTMTWRTFQHTFTAVGTSATIQFVETGAGSTGLFVDNFVFAGVGPCEGDLSITKDDGVATYTPGLDLIYTIVVRNIGTTPVTGAQISDLLPAGITSASWTCGSATGGGVCAVAAGTGAINTTANLPIGASVTYRLSMGVPSNYTGNLTNTARVTAPAGMTDTDTSNNQAGDTNTMESPPTSNACSPVRILGNTTFAFNPLGVAGTIARTGNWQANTYWTTSGGNFTITWTFGQPVPVDWIQFVVSDIGVEDYQTLPPPTVAVTFGAGSVATPADLVRREGELLYNASTGVLTYDRSGPLRQQAVMRGNSTGTVRSVTLTANSVGAGDHINVSLFARPACLTVEKLSEGGTGSFQIDMSNVVQADSTAVASTTLTTTTAGTPVSSPGFFSRGPGTGITLGEVVPAGWGIAAAVCTDQNAGSTGNPTVISTFATPMLTIPAANVRPEADIVCRFDNGPLPAINLSKITSQIAGGPFGFTLGNTTVASPAPVSTSASASPVAVDGDPGAETAFRVSSLGADVTIDESSLPAGWRVNGATCTDAGGASVGGLASGRYTIPAASITMGQTFNCNFVNEPMVVDLGITKTDGAATYVPGFDVNYTMVVSNAGPGDAVGARINDPLPAGIATASWTCGNATGGAVCGAASGTGAIDTTADLPTGASVTYTLNMVVPPTYTGNLVNTATVAVPAGFTDADTSNNSASDTDTMEPPPTSGACSPRVVVQGASFTLAPFPTTGTVQKSAAEGWQAGNPWATLGGNYTFRWTFSQPVPVSWIRFAVLDVNTTTTPPPTFTITLGAGSTATIADFSFAEGDLLYNASTGVLRYDATGPLRQSGHLQGNGGDTVTSITIVGNGPSLGDNIANSLFVRPACLTLQKTSEDGTGSFQIDMSNVVQANGTAVPATTLTTTAPDTPVSSPERYSIINQNVVLSEVVPAGWNLDSAVCTDQNAGGTGNPPVIGSFATPTLTIPAANVRPESDMRCLFTNRLLPSANLAIVKSATPDTVRSGGTVVYTLQVTNNGPNAADGAVLTDLQPVGVDCSTGTLTCGSETNGALCPASPTVPALQGAGVAIPTFPVGSSMQFTLTCTVTATGR